MAESGASSLGKIVVGIVGAVLLLGLGGLSGWMLSVEGRVSGMQSVDLGQTSRIEQLESGRTTPMAAETRAVIDAHDQRIERLERALDDILTIQREILMRLPPRSGAGNAHLPDAVAEALRRRHHGPAS